MPRFKGGDRVQLTGEIARFYRTVIGVVGDSSTDQTSVLVQHVVRLADGTVAKFFDFQLQTPPVVHGRVLVDGPFFEDDGTLGGREIHLVGGEIEIHLEISGVFNKSFTERVSLGKTAMIAALVTILVHEQPIVTKSTDDRGEVAFPNAPSGDVTIETLVPGKRIVVSLTV